MGIHNVFNVGLAVGLIQKVLQQRVAVFAHDGFGVKLHAFDIEGVVAHAHDFTTVRITSRPCRDAQTIGQAVALNHQGMIACDLERVGQSCEHARVVVVQSVHFAVHRRACADDFATEGLADGLVTQTYAEDGQFAFEMRQCVQTDTGFSRCTRSGREAQMRWLCGFDVGQADFIVALDRNGGAEFAEILHEVKGE